MIPCDFQTLQNQAPSTVDFYLHSAASAADTFDIPKGERTQFYCAYIAACTSDYNNAALSKVLDEAIEGLAEAISSLKKDEEV